MPLIFDPVIREDLNTDFKCVTYNTRSFQTLHTTVKEGMYFADSKGENMLNVLWMLDKATSSPDDYLGGPLCFLLLECLKANLSFFMTFVVVVASQEAGFEKLYSNIAS